MSDETPTKSNADETRIPATTAEPTEDVDEQEDREFAERLRRYLDYAVLAGLLLLALIAALQFYLNASQTISTWVNPEFRSLFHAAFNVVLFLGAALGISVQLRRLTKD